MRLYRLIGADGAEYLSPQRGHFGGHRRLKIYGRLDCPSALRWLALGHYAQHRVFFADEAAAVAAGFRPCARCLPAAYARWRASQKARPQRASNFIQGGTPTAKGGTRS